MYKVDADGQKHFRNLHDVFMDLMITSHTTSKNMEKDLLAISGGKFQWSKVASVLGSYRDFLHAYTMSLDSTNFSKGQLEAQLDTITRKFEQLKATMTGIATGIGASGLSAYIKNILSSLNAFAKSLQGIPTYVWKIIGGLVALATAVGSALVVFKLLTAGISAVTTGVGLYTTAVTAGAIATEGMAAAATVATGGLNILLGLVVAGVAAFLGYNAIVSSNIEAINNEAQALEDSVQVKRQEIEMSEKQGELIETLCNNHVKLQEALANSKEGTEQHKQAEEDLKVTDQELTAIIGEDAMKQIDWNGDLQGSIKGLKDEHSKKTKQLRLELAQSLEAQAAYQEAEQQRIEATITNLETEGTAWTVLGHIIESVLHGIGSAMVTMGEGLQAMGGKVKEIFPSAGEWLQAQGSSIMLSGIKHQNFHSEWSDDRVGSPAEIAAQKAKLAQSKVASNKARLEAEAIRGTGGESNPYSNVSGGQEDSGIITDDPNKDKTGTKGTKGTKTPKGAKEADNSPMAMSYRYLTSAKNLDKNFVAGLLGNAIRETGGWDLNPDADNGSHRGLFQWSYNDASRTGRWYDFMDTFLKERNISESQYWAMDKDQKRILQLDFGLYEMQEGKEWASYKKILDQRPSTPEQWASLINQHFERSGEPAGSPIDMERQGNARQIAEKYGKNNGEINYTDIDSLIKKNYQEVKRVYDEKLESLKYEREKIGQSVSASEKLNLYKEIVNPNDFAALKEARKDYKALLLEAVKEERKRLEASKSATDTQVKAIEKMADAEIAFAEKLGLINKSDVRKYNYEKNESNYARQKPILDAKLGATVDLQKATADEMLAVYQQLIYAQSELEARHYAEKLFYLSRDVDATQKALNEEFKLEETYQNKRRELNEEAFLHKSRYALTFIDSLTKGIEEGLEGILNRTKSFAEAFRDIFKGLVQDIIKLFSQDFAERIKKWLSNAIFKPKATGNKAGAYEDIVGMKSAGGKSIGGDNNSFNLIGWAQNSLSSLGGGTDKGKGVGQNPLVKALGGYSFASEMRKAVQPGMIALRNTTQMTINGMSNITQQGMQTISGGIQTGTQAMTMTWQGMEVSKQMATEMGNAGIVANSQATAATVQATTAQMMGWIMAVLALFSLFGGGGGSSTTETHDSVNLGRSPDSYYMTPSPVLQSTTFNVPSFDIGGNIEQDMFAMVHKGEMVLTPEQAEVIRSSARTGGNIGNGSANANVKSSINVTTVSSRGFEQVLRDYNRDLSKNVKKGIRNGYLNAKGLV